MNTITMAPPVPPERISLMGMSIDKLTEAQAIAHILSALAAGHGGVVITPNLDHVRQYVNFAEVRQLYSQADLVLADGMPVIWASRLQRTALPGRIPGSGLIHTLTAAAAEQQRSIFLLGGNPGAAESAAAIFARRHPALRIAGFACPPVGFEKDPAAMDALIRTLVAANPDIIYVGLGFPKQERVAALLRPHLPKAWFLGIGISFSFVAGEVKRAPSWLQKIGLEWMHRLAQEPRRLFKRYIVHDIPFAMWMLGHCIVHPRPTAVDAMNRTERPSRNAVPGPLHS